jgi:DNA-binding transcriptional MerR regulator
MGLRVSEATLRKYVQLGLLPRSRRVGTRGRHQGSWGLYPAWTARQVVEIKRLLAEGRTIQDIATGYASVFAGCKEAGEALQVIRQRLEALRSRDTVDHRKVGELLDMIEKAADLTEEVAEKATGQADFVEIAI